MSYDGSEDYEAYGVYGPCADCRKKDCETCPLIIGSEKEFEHEQDE